MKKIFTLLALFGLILLIPSHKTTRDGDKPYVDGEIMVKIKPGLVSGQESVVNSLLSDFSFIQLEHQSKLSHRLGIHLFRFTPEMLPDEDVLREFRRHPLVELAQFNHFIEMRETIPSDQYFDQQWNMMNIGQNGGLLDADVDATDAWDYATGMLTATGDTIVIAIVDDGFDLDHEDLIFWTNRDEIPGNGIDDDTNGYVDDHYGWNSYTQSGNISQADHGTHVTGIASSQGNNDRGVAGINWDTPVMAVQGSSTLESVVVVSYGYVYEMRKRYNESNGARGAFIVSTNASFGVNQGQPENYPIWGAMYDSLGAEGVLSAGATANANWNIDEVGDIPTAFDNEHLISVTNTTNQDTKASSAGFGLETIDLGAPGTAVYSTRQNNSYGTKTGTSMASPHVAGAIALMYAAATEEFMEAYHNDPSGMALVIKQHLLNGTDPLPSLEGLCVTGGRLNLHKAIMQMLDPPATVMPMSIHKDLMSGSSDSVLVSLTNNTEEEFTYYLTYDATVLWLSLNRNTGSLAAGATDTFTVYFDTEGLDTALYFTYVNIDYADSLQYMLPVNLEVMPPVGVRENIVTPETLSMASYPNPFSDRLNLQFALGESAAVQLAIYSLSGARVKQLISGWWPAGEHSILWDGKDGGGAALPAGLYFVRLTAGDKVIIRKLLKTD